jgi:hypothetical protein
MIAQQRIGNPMKVGAVGGPYFKYAFVPKQNEPTHRWAQRTKVRQTHCKVVVPGATFPLLKPISPAAKNAFRKVGTPPGISFN